MTKTKNIVHVDVPHRISGFFEIVDEFEGKKIKRPEKIGSRGAGFNLSALGRTSIKVEKLNVNEESQCEIYINGQILNEKAETTKYIYKYIQPKLKVPHKIKIDHQFDLPVGCGYGASGSGALGTVYGLNQRLKLGLNQYEIGRIAHIAEVVNRTGLGTVCGQLGGGLCLLKEPGYPCNYESIIIPKGLKIICGTFGMIHTKSILIDPVLNSKIKEAGKKALNKLMIEPSIYRFIQASIEFVKETNMLNILDLSKTKELMMNLNKLNIIGASMNQLGRSVFAICEKSEELKVLEVFDSFKPQIQLFNLEFNTNAPKISSN